jgi:hypothetical protein
MAAATRVTPDPGAGTKFPACSACLMIDIELPPIPNGGYLRAERRSAAITDGDRISRPA